MFSLFVFLQSGFGVIAREKKFDCLVASAELYLFSWEKATMKEFCLYFLKKSLGVHVYPENISHLLSFQKLKDIIVFKCVKRLHLCRSLESRCFGISLKELLFIVVIQTWLYNISGSSFFLYKRYSIIRKKNLLIHSNFFNFLHILYSCSP